jgi:hypothetical protein
MHSKANETSVVHELPPSQLKLISKKTLLAHKPFTNPSAKCLSRSTYHFHHFQSILEEDEIRSRSILTIIQQNDHGIRIHFISSIELPIFEIADNFLGIVLCGFLKGTNTVGISLGEMGLDSLHVSLQICQVRFLVEGRGGETHAVDDIVDSLDPVFEVVSRSVFSGGIGT